MVFKGEDRPTRITPKRLEGKRVVVVGLGNSGRYVDGKPFDHVLTLRVERARATLEKVLPRLTEIVFSR